jgi:N-acetylglucosaminyldiphosphoundecaprenol N-acetyl-beta-D-mannosaminyltransferase
MKTTDSSSPSHSILITILERVFQGKWEDLYQQWGNWLRADALTTVFTPNPEQIVTAQKNAAFLTVLLRADVLLPDGSGLVWALRRWQRSQQNDHRNGQNEESEEYQRFSGREVVEWWLDQARQNQIATLLLGSRAGIAEALARKYDPERQWCFASEGYADVTHPTDEETAGLKAVVEEHRPEVIFVAFGAPWQEMWVSEQRDWLERAGVKIAMVCGGALDVLSPATDLRPPPDWMVKSNLEWLFRLAQEPWRWRRQLRGWRFFWWAWQMKPRRKQSN